MSVRTVDGSTSPDARRRRSGRGLALATGAGLLALAGMLATPVAAWADPGTDNSGDVWVANAGTPPGPGHQMDPQLTCTTIDILGAQMAEAGGTFTVSSIGSDGSNTVVYTGTWVNTQGTGQPMAAVDPNVLAADLPADATADPQQGYHFQLVVDQAPQKSKTFWVSGCLTQPGSGSGGGGYV